MSRSLSTLPYSHYQEKDMSRGITVVSCVLPDLQLGESIPLRRYGPDTGGRKGRKESWLNDVEGIVISVELRDAGSGGVIGFSMDVKERLIVIVLLVRCAVNKPLWVYVAKRQKARLLFERDEELLRDNTLR
ncbi:hypothetical protein Tco_0952965 [Tanacetum coccineum]|uniref:Uncharacterized protein n=1 Tax=Tanacetum coccineum TaxID=301880 RepID=A0ABQ5DYI5_9ASTR